LKGLPQSQEGGRGLLFGGGDKSNKGGTDLWSTVSPLIPPQNETLQPTATLIWPQ
jgi:hypothetical protein